jgi:2-amino-4-hydroxy-6-hydroxymethyldihydropteridine diphosphokinase
MKILALGSNLPYKKNSPKQNIELAYEILDDHNIKILKKSNLYQTEAYPNKSDPLFCNSAISIETDLGPDELLKNILEIEKKFGRERNVKNSPRTLDIDIISYDKLILDEENLKIPHPNLHKRPFVFLPVNDLDDCWIHPVYLKTIKEIIKEFDAKELNTVKKIT